MKTFTLRLTDDEAKAIDVMAKVTRLSKNSFIRGCTHLAARFITDYAMSKDEQSHYRPAAQDLISENMAIFESIFYDEIDVLNEHFDDIK